MRSETEYAADICSGDILSGDLRVHQPKKGYRFSIDSLILASMADMEKTHGVVDLGAGCGIISLILARHNPSAHFWCVEIQPELATLAAFNAKINLLSNRVTVLCRDLKRLKPEDLSGPVNLVVSNPPFRPVGTGRVGPDAQRTIAMHEFRVSLPELVFSAHRLLEPSGRLVMIHHAGRLGELMLYLKQAGFETSWIRPVRPRIDSNASRVVIEAVKGTTHGLKILPSLILHKLNGDYSEMATEIIEWAGI